MIEKCGNQIRFLAAWKNGKPIYETFDCVKDKGHVDDHETYGHAGETNHHFRLFWWSGDWEDSTMQFISQEEVDKQ